MIIIRPEWLLYTIIIFHMSKNYNGIYFTVQNDHDPPITKIAERKRRRKIVWNEDDKQLMGGIVII